MAGGRNAPTNVTWIISFILFLVALAGHFDVVQVPAKVETWSWILGYGLLLVACKVKGL